MCLSHEVVRFPVFQLGVLATFIYQGKTKKFLCMLRLTYESKLEFSDVLSTCERLCFKLKYWAHCISAINLVLIIFVLVFSMPSCPVCCFIYLILFHFPCHRSCQLIFGLLVNVKLYAGSLSPNIYINKFSPLHRAWKLMTQYRSLPQLFVAPRG